METNNTKSAAVIIPTFNGGDDLLKLIEKLKKCDGNFDLLIIDSGSQDHSIDSLRLNPFVKLVEIENKDFNHGGTRQLMTDLFPDYEIYVFMTQDAYPADKNAIANLIKSFNNKKIGASCGRQLPHPNADPFAAHARLFNYPDKSSIKSKSDISRLGLKVPFISNSFSAYRRSALEEAGGFPVQVILGEDMFVAAKMVLCGWHIGYCSNAQVHHSHNYSAIEEWKRYFDIGVFHAQQPWLQKNFGNVGGEGFRFLRSELKYLKNHKPLWISSIIRNAGKLISYKIGKKESLLPCSIKKKLSMHRNYWKN